MIITLSIYFSITLIMLFFNSISIDVKKRHIGVIKNNIPIATIIIFSIIFGIRYNVGIDHLSYLEDYNTVLISGIKWGQTEFGYELLRNIFAYFGCHSSLFFFTIAFLQLFLLFNALRDYYKEHSYLIWTFMAMTIFLNFMNGMRQELAFCFWINAVKYIAEKNSLKHYLYLLIAISFHYSAAILVIVYPILNLRKSYFSNIRIQIILFIIAIVVSHIINIDIYILKIFEPIGKLLGYGGYYNMIENDDLVFIEARRDAGLGYIIIITMNFILISNSNNVKSYYASAFLDKIYDLYYLGVIYMCLFGNSLILSRINYYFYNFNFIICAFTIRYLTKRNNLKNYISLVCLISFCILLFTAIIIYRGEESAAIYSTFLEQ